MPSASASTRPDVASLFGWFLLAVLIVGMMFGWMWRFRPKLWHRDNALVLTGLLVVGATIALKLTAGRAILPFFLPTAAIGMLLAILLDASLATVVIALVAIIGGAVNGASLEFATYVFLGGMAGIVAIRRGDRFQVFVQAAVAVFVVNAAVVTDLLAARRARRARRPRAVVRLGGVGRGIRRRRGRDVRGPRVGVRHPDRLPAAGAGQPVAAAAAPPAGRDARHVPPLADGRQPRRARRRGHRRATRWSPASPPTTTTSASSRTRWASSRTRPAARTSTTSSTLPSAPRSSSSTSPTASTSPTRAGCRRRSSPTSRSTTGPRS